MKTVGIITTFRQPNFGSVLQAYALQRVINKAGYESKIIDYYYPNNFHWNRGLQWGRKQKRTLNDTLRTIVISILREIGIRPKSKMKLLNKFIKEEMKCTKPYKTYEELHTHPPLFDIYVSGSDQIWNPNTMYGDMSYMLDFAPIGRKKISYSSSFSCDTIPQMYLNDYRRNLANYSAISVREKNGIRIIKEITGRTDTKLVLDPTLLLDKKDWDKLANKAKELDIPSKYILCYKLAYTYNPDYKMNELLSLLQKEYDLPILSFTEMPTWEGGKLLFLSDRHYNIGNYEFLNIFRNAEVIATSSFHGTAFAINYAKPFLALTDGKSNSDDRIRSLLKFTDLTPQLVTTETVLNGDINPNYDFSRAQEKLGQLRKASLGFLLHNL